MNLWLWIQSEKIDGWYVMSGQAEISGNWTAWARQTPLNHRDPLSEVAEGNGVVYLEYGANRQEAIDNLVKNDIQRIASCE